MKGAGNAFRLLRRFAADRRGSGIAEAGLIVLVSLVVFLVFIASWPLAFMRLQKTQEAVTFVAEVLAREPIWTDAMLADLARLAGRTLDSATEADEAARTTVTIYAARVYGTTPEGVTAAFCRAARFTRVDGVTSFLETEDDAGRRNVVPDLPEGALRGTSFIYRVDYVGEMRVWRFRYTFRKSAASRPVNGVITVQSTTDPRPVLCS